MDPVRVLLVDDDPDLHAFVNARLVADDCFEVVGHAADANEAVVSVISLSPDALVIDGDLDYAAGVIEASKRQSPRLLVVTLCSPLEASRAAVAGTDGILVKNKGVGDRLIGSLKSLFKTA